MSETKSLKDRLTEDMKEFQSSQHPIFKVTLINMQEHSFAFNEIKKRVNRVWRFIFTNEAYDTGYILGKKNTVSLINHEKKIAVVLTVNTSIRNKEISLERLEKFSEETPNYRLVYAVINGPSEEYRIDKVLCLSGDKVLDFILGDKKSEVISELKRCLAKLA